MHLAYVMGVYQMKKKKEKKKKCDVTPDTLLPACKCLSWVQSVSRLHETADRHSIVDDISKWGMYIECVHTQCVYIAQNVDMPCFDYLLNGF